MRIRLALAAVAVLAIPAPAQAAPSGGVYHGTVNGVPAPPPCHTNEGAGFFRFQSGDIVPAGDFSFCGGSAHQSKIVAPSSFHCNVVNANLSVSSIPVQGGSFVYKANEPLGPMGANRKVTFKGSWDSSTKVTGKTRIKGNGCDHTDKWVMKKI
jgi:hypothetical protein